MSSRVAAAVVIAGPWLIACGGEDPQAWEEGRPRIDELEFVRQAPQNPRALEFGLEFFDADGDTGRGLLHLFLDGDETSERPLRDLFAAARPALPLDATEGRVSVTVELSGMIEPGRRVELAFMLEDEARRRSNQPSIVLEAQPE